MDVLRIVLIAVIGIPVGCVIGFSIGYYGVMLAYKIEETVRRNK